MLLMAELKLHPGILYLVPFIVFMIKQTRGSTQLPIIVVHRDTTNFSKILDQNIKAIKLCIQFIRNKVTTKLLI